MHITFETWEYEWAFMVGVRRFTANWCKQDAPHYHRDFMEEDRKATVSGALCELAVAKHLNQYWHGSVWCASDHHKYRTLSDVGRNIEVRRIRTARGVGVRATDAGKIIWACRIDDPEYRTCELLGWIDGDRALELGEKHQQYVMVPLTALNPPDRS